MISPWHVAVQVLASKKGRGFLKKTVIVILVIFLFFAVIFGAFNDVGSQHNRNLLNVFFMGEEVTKEDFVDDKDGLKYYILVTALKKKLESIDDQFDKCENVVGTFDSLRMKEVFYVTTINADDSANVKFGKVDIEKFVKCFVDRIEVELFTDENDEEVKRNITYLKDETQGIRDATNYLGRNLSASKTVKTPQGTMNEVDAFMLSISNLDATIFGKFDDGSIDDDYGSLDDFTEGDLKNGNEIAKQALAKLGCRYWWGKEGPTYFDCSGLVYWACKEAGLSIGRTTAAMYAKSGTDVPYNKLQPGDVITFNYGSGVAHIGIYIGGGKMVNAKGKGSGTKGQYPEQCVQVASVTPDSYWYQYIYNCRRLYNTKE